MSRPAVPVDPGPRAPAICRGQLQDSIASLLSELGEAADSAVDVADIRQRLAWVLTGLRHQRARESDLICEAYYDAFRSGIAVDVGDAPGGR